MAEKLTSFAAYWAGLSQEERHEVRSYQSVAAALNKLYLAICARTIYKEWEDPFRMAPQDRDIGDCHLSTADSAQEIENQHLLALRERRSAETPGPQHAAACGHHRQGIGCILGDLKSPFCLRYFRNPLLQEMHQRFGPDIFQEFKAAKDEAISLLKLIQQPKRDWNEVDALVVASQVRLRAVTLKIERFPVLANR